MGALAGRIGEGTMAQPVGLGMTGDDDLRARLAAEHGQVYYVVTLFRRIGRLVVRLV